MAAEAPVIAATIAQLRAYCPPFGGRVAGAADFERGLRHYNANMVLPAAYVIAPSPASDGNLALTGTLEYVRRTLAVVVELDATADRRGQAPVMTFEAIEAALQRALLNWQPGVCLTRNQQGYFFTGGRFLDLDRARLFYQWEFALDTQLDDTDAWAPPSEPLETIEVDIFKAPQTATPAVIIKVPTA